MPEIYGADARPKKLEWMVRQAEIIDANGKQTTYTVQQVKVNIGLPDARFVFQPPGGTDVVDLR